MQATNNPNSLKRVAIATMIGTAIEYFDNYIYAMAAVLVFNHQFFHAADPLSGQIAALSTLALTFIARPLGAVLFGHFGDRLGRKNTFVMSLLVMGISTVVIGLLPTYDSIGIWATILLCLCRIGQGIGLGGEWGGAALVAIENAPEGKRGWYGTFPQLGAPLGLLLANGIFLLITTLFGQAAMIDWAWRIPFLSSFVLVAIGLYVRLKLTEAPIFIAVLNKPKPKALPMIEVIVTHFKPFFLGMMICIAGYVLFYIMIAFSQIYAKSAPTVSEAGYAMGLGFSPQIFTALLMCSAISLAITIAISGKYIDIIGRRIWLIWTTFGVAIFGLALPYFLDNGTTTSLFWFLMIGMGLIGMGYGPLASFLPELFPTHARYSGASLTYNISGLFGASVAAIIALPLNANYGLKGVGIYLTLNAILSLIGLWFITETRDKHLR
ncbi:MFS transporter [Haemophilus parainfluenzae]|uniref:MFS transporter n=1 Tax=Haemophilus parainfluenzae TaxID=729 RepID=UPI000FFF1CF3|nr:MFS transporter [Haemophilus parainfluenzae]KAB1991573.1 MHS family MFS transporter [Haemophilus parainfluenzae]QAT94540.1 MHS family MFS transporter [Haemophilus parainfluenzae]